MKTLSSWRSVNQCLKCTLKYKIKPLACSCSYEKFRVVKVYCLDKILSYGAFMNVIVGGRRKGKTFSVVEYCISKWQEEKRRFAWVRRYKTEMKKALEAFSKLGYLFDGSGVYYEEEISDLVIIKGKEKEVTKKKKIYIGVIVTITTASRIRGGEFTDYDTLVIDEYGDESGTSFRTEFTLINSLITSIIDEKSDGICFVLTNNVNRFLPLFNHINVHWDQEWTYNWKVDAVVHIVDEKDRKWIGKSSKWLQSTEYFDYAVHNKPMDYDKQLIESYKLDYLVPLFCFKIGPIKKPLRFMEITNNEYVIDECLNCNHEIFAIDQMNSISDIVVIDFNKQAIIYNAYINKKLKYSNPLIKNETRNWVARHLHLFEN